MYSKFALRVTGVFMAWSRRPYVQVKKKMITRRIFPRLGCEKVMERKWRT